MGEVRRQVVEGRIELPRIGGVRRTSDAARVPYVVFVQGGFLPEVGGRCSSMSLRRIDSHGSGSKWWSHGEQSHPPAVLPKGGCDCDATTFRVRE